MSEPPPLEPMDVASSYAAARSLARREARHFYFAFQWLTPPRRDGMCTVYGFLRKLDDLADTPTAEAAASADRFEPCRAMLDFAYGNSLGERPNVSDPLASAFADTVARFEIPRESFDEAIAGAEMDLEARRYATFADLRQYCFRAASVVGRMCIQVFGHSAGNNSGGSRAIALADELGVAFQLTNILRDLREDAARGRVYLPTEDLVRFGVEEHELGGTTTSERLRKLLAFEAERARELYEHSAPLDTLIEPKSRRALAGMRAMYRAILSKIERSDYDVLSRPVRLTLREKLMIAARAYFQLR